jgi:uncharacterized protein YbaP (TraB family)
MGIALNLLRTGLLLLVLTSCRPAAAETPYSDARFWRIERDGAAPSFILGTMHVTDPEVTALSPEIKRAFDGSQALAVELTMDAATQAVLQGAMRSEDKHWMETRLNDRERNLLADAAGRYQMPLANLSILEPWAVAMMFSAPPQELLRQSQGLQPLDMQLMDRAEATGKRMIALEQVEEQLSALTGYSEREQIALLVQTLESVSRIDENYARMKGAYLSGDLADLDALADESLQGLEPALKGRVLQRLIADRNRKMAERLDPLLAQGGLFVAVGALHLPGEGGVLNLLAQRGYRITAVE